MMTTRLGEMPALPLKLGQLDVLHADPRLWGIPGANNGAGNISGRCSRWVVWSKKDRREERKGKPKRAGGQSGTASQEETINGDAYAPVALDGHLVKRTLLQLVLCVVYTF